MKKSAFYICALVLGLALGFIGHLFISSRAVEELQMTIKDRDREIATLKEKIAVIETGPRGNKYIVPLGKNVAIAGQVVPAEDLYKDFHWTMEDGTYRVFYKRRSSTVGNPFYELQLVMERKLGN